MYLLTMIIIMTVVPIITIIATPMITTGAIMAAWLIDFESYSFVFKSKAVKKREMILIIKHKTLGTIITSP